MRFMESLVTTYSPRMRRTRYDAPCPTRYMGCSSILHYNGAVSENYVLSWCNRRILKDIELFKNIYLLVWNKSCLFGANNFNRSA